MTHQQTLAFSVTNAIDYFVKFIKLPEGYSTEQIDKLYNALDGIRDAKGKRLIEGHLSVNGIMTIAVDAAKLAEIKKGIVTVLQNFEPMEVRDSDANMGFLTPYNTKEQENAGNLDGNSGAKSGIRSKVSAQYNANLRRETADMVARKIRERLEARTAGKQARSSQARSSQDRPLTQSRPLTQRDVARALEQLGYHGSPYFFDRFTLSHIGSGEGAQAHGLGLYFALSRRTAEEQCHRNTAQAPICLQELWLQSAQRPQWRSEPATSGLSADNPGAGVNKPYVEPAFAGDNKAFDLSRELFTAPPIQWVIAQTTRGVVFECIKKTEQKIPTRKKTLLSYAFDSEKQSLKKH